MRTWGRIPASAANPYSSAIGSFAIQLSGIGGGDPNYPDGYRWVEVTTDANGYDDAVWLTTLAQVLQLNLNESPIFGSYGIPAQQSVLTQVPPDYYVTLTQQNFAAYFLALIITKEASADPTYRVNVAASPGATLSSPVPL